MHDALVDVEGFPRNDIDIYQVRNARHQIICMQTDLKVLMLNIESGLHSIAAQQVSSVANASTKMANMDLRAEDSANRGTTSASSAMAHQLPFASVSAVERNSPAERAVCTY